MNHISDDLLVIFSLSSMLAVFCMLLSLSQSQELCSNWRNGQRMLRLHYTKQSQTDSLSVSPLGNKHVMAKYPFLKKK